MQKTRGFLDHLSHEDLLDRLALALDAANVGIWDWDLRDDTVQFDRRWCEMLGLNHALTPPQLASWTDRIHPDDRDACAAALANHLEGRTDHVETVVRMRHEDGHYVDVLERGRISGRDAAGRPIRFTGTHFDVSVTVRAKHVVEAQEHQLKEMVRHLPSAVAMVDVNMRVLAASRKWTVQHDVAHRVIEGQRYGDLFPELEESWREIHARGLRGETQSADEERIEHDDGRVSWLQWDVRPWLTIDDEIGGLLLMSEDITDRVERRRVEEHEARLASLGYLAGGIAHEINSPLQVITLEADVIRHELGEEHPNLDEIRKSQEAIEETAKRASSIIQAMKTLARDGTGDDATEIPVLLLLHDADTLCRSRFMATDVELVIEDRAPGAMVRGRAPEIVQILLNLLNNAYDAVRASEEKWVRLEVDEIDDKIVFRCVDSGPGVPEDSRARILEPFFTTKSVGEGTGLGLSIAHSLSSRNGGVLELCASDSTTFSLTLDASAKSLHRTDRLATQRDAP